MVTGDVYRVRLCWSLLGEAWTNVVYVNQVGGSTPDIKRAISVGISTGWQWPSAMLSLLPSSVVWQSNLIQRLGDPPGNPRRYRVAIPGSILTEQALAANQCLLATYTGVESDPYGFGNFHLSGFSEVIVRGDQLFFLRKPTIDGWGDGFTMQFSGLGAEFRLCLKVVGGGFCHIGEAKVSTLARPFRRRTRKTCVVRP